MGKGGGGGGGERDISESWWTLYVDMPIMPPYIRKDPNAAFISLFR